MGMTQKPVGLLQPSRLQKAADVGGRDPDPLQKLLSNHLAGNALLPASLLQLLGIALSPASEAEIVSTHQAAGVIFGSQQAKKLLPGHFHQRPVKGQLHYPADPAPQQLMPVRGGIDQRCGDAPDHLIRMAQKGHHAGLSACLPRHLAAGLQQRLVALMHPVKIAQSINNFLFHSSTNYTSKKLLTVDITPFFTFASIRNSPLWL